MKSKKFLIAFLSAFLLGIGWNVYKHFAIPNPKYMTSIEMDRDHISVQETYQLFPGKCYILGLWSNGDVFDGRGVLKITHDGASYPLKGIYTLSYYSGGALVGTKSVTGETFTSISMDGKDKRSWIGLDRLEIPYKDKYSDLTVKLDIVNPQSKFRDAEQDIYFYLDEVKCRTAEEKVTIERREKKNLLIDNVETNVTLLPLYYALKAKDTSKVKEPLTNGLNPEVSMLGARRPVHYASFFNDAETLSYLITRSVDLNAKDTFGKTPLHYSIENNATDAVKALLEHGADLGLVEEVDDYLYHRRKRVIAYVTLRDYYEMTNILLQHGLNPNYRGKNAKYRPVLNRLYVNRNSNY